MQYKKIYELANSLSSIPKEEWGKLEALLEARTYKKSDILISAGEMPSHVYFVESGILRIYYMDQDGKEFTKVFRGAGGLIGPYAEILQKVSSRAYIQAVSEVSCFAFNYLEFEKLLEADENICWQILARKIAEDNYIEKDRREFEFLQMTAQERYLQFQNSFKELVDQIPQYQVASYLGMAPESLNRMLKKMKKPL